MILMKNIYEADKENIDRIIAKSENSLKKQQGILTRYQGKILKIIRVYA